MHFKIIFPTVEYLWNLDTLYDLGAHSMRWGWCILISLEGCFENKATFCHWWYLRMRKLCVNSLSNVRWGLVRSHPWPGLLALRPDNGISPNSFSLPFPIGHAHCIVAQCSLLPLLPMIVQITESWTSSLWLYLTILAVRTWVHILLYSSNQRHS